MTTTDKNTNVLKSILTALLVSALQLPTIAAASTQVRLQSISEQLKITEGYTASVEEWSAASAANPTQRHIIIIDDDYHHSRVWVDDVGTSLYADHDHDGYFGGFSLSFDVDTSNGDRDIYATIFLQLGSGSPVELHTTEVFTIYSQSGSDVYRVDAELIDNYQAGEYHARIDIHDAHNGSVLDSVTHETHRNLRYLPLESEPYQGANSSVIVTEYAGFAGPALLVLLAFTALLRRGRGASGILGNILAAARATPDDTNYEQASITASAIDRLPF